jgi:hypothetical protein
VYSLSGLLASLSGLIYIARLNAADADLAVFSRHPLDPYTVCQMTIIDGTVYFDRAKYLEEMKKAEEEKKKEAEAKAQAERDNKANPQ